KALGIGHWALVQDQKALGIGHWALVQDQKALGIGHWALVEGRKTRRHPGCQAGADRTGLVAEPTRSVAREKSSKFKWRSSN
ncbi:MAG: hypothetical protein L6Q35_14830, partial [Phycisphaerales bacterium]|nr:hypothetical protein [Phycisphaerales bacterium]